MSEPDIWPFRPLLNGFQEELQFFTSVLKAKTGEQRFALRSEPREEWVYNHVFDAFQFSWAKAFYRENGTGDIRIPMWVHARQPESARYFAEHLNLDAATADFRVGDTVIVWKNWDDYFLMTVDEVHDTYIHFTDQIGVDIYGTNYLVAPLRTCYLPQGMQIQRSPTAARLNLRFQVRDTINLDPDDETYFDDYPVFNNYNVLLAPHIASAQISEQMVRTSQYVDNGFGPVAVEELYTYDQFGQMLTMLPNLGAELWERRRWLHWTRGRVKPFWFPTYNNDLTLLASVGLSDTEIEVKRIGSEASYASKRIMVLMNNGTRYYKQITDALNHETPLYGDDPETRLTIANAFGAAVDPANVQMISFMTLVRLDTDNITIDYRTPGKASIQVPVVEVSQ